MAELGLGMVADISLNLIPITFIVTDFLAVSTNRKQAAQCLDLGKCFLKLFNKSFPFFLRPPAARGCQGQINRIQDPER